MIFYQENTVDQVYEFFIEAFTPPPGSTILKIEHFVDTTKGMVIFKIITEESPTSKN